MDKGDVKTATLHRQMTVLRAMFNKVSKEHEIKEDRLHPFTDFDVPNLRDDAIERADFTKEELDILRQKIAARKPHIAFLIHLMLETGLRVNECCGLRVGDISIDEEYDQPNTYLFAGRFYDKNSAYKFKHKIKDNFPDALVIKKKLSLPVLKSIEETENNK